MLRWLLMLITGLSITFPTGGLINMCYNASYASMATFELTSSGSDCGGNGSPTTCSCLIVTNWYFLPMKLKFERTSPCKCGSKNDDVALEDPMNPTHKQKINKSISIRMSQIRLTVNSSCSYKFTFSFSKLLISLGVFKDISCGITLNSSSAVTRSTTHLPTTYNTSNITWPNGTVSSDGPTFDDFNISDYIYEDYNYEDRQDDDHEPRTGMIVGIAVGVGGGFILIVALTVVVVVISRRRTKSKDPHHLEVNSHPNRSASIDNSYESPSINADNGDGCYQPLGVSSLCEMEFSPSGHKTPEINSKVNNQRQNENYDNINIGNNEITDNRKRNVKDKDFVGLQDSMIAGNDVTLVDNTLYEKDA